MVLAFGLSLDYVEKYTNPGLRVITCMQVVVISRGYTLMTKITRMSIKVFAKIWRPGWLYLHIYHQYDQCTCGVRYAEVALRKINDILTIDSIRFALYV